MSTIAHRPLSKLPIAFTKDFSFSTSMFAASAVNHILGLHLFGPPLSLAAFSDRTDLVRKQKEDIRAMCVNNTYRTANSLTKLLMREFFLLGYKYTISGLRAEHTRNQCH